MWHPNPSLFREKQELQVPSQMWVAGQGIGLMASPTCFSVCLFFFFSFSGYVGLALLAWISFWDSFPCVAVDRIFAWGKVSAGAFYVAIFNQKSFFYSYFFFSLLTRYYQEICIIPRDQFLKFFTSAQLSLLLNLCIAFSLSFIVLFRFKICLFCVISISLLKILLSWVHWVVLNFIKPTLKWLFWNMFLVIHRSPFFWWSFTGNDPGSILFPCLFLFLMALAWCLCISGSSDIFQPPGLPWAI